MQQAILVKNGSAVLAKKVYGGAITDELMADEMSRLEAKYPTYTFTLYANDTDSEFINAVVDTPTFVF